MGLFGDIADFVGDIGGIASGVGAVAGLFGESGAEKQNQMAMAQSDKQMDFQERMSNTAYQRSMADMRSAGLNPMLAYKQGGASSPGGAMAPIVDEMAPALHSARESSRTFMQLQSMKQDIDTNLSQEELNQAAKELNTQLEKKAKWDTEVSAAQWLKTNNEAAVAHETAINLAVDNQIKKAGVHSALAEARIKTREAEDVEKWGTSKVGGVAATVERAGERAYNFTAEQLRRFKAFLDSGEFN